MTYQIHQRDAELRGEAKGREEGKEELARESAKNFYELGISIDTDFQLKS